MDSYILIVVSIPVPVLLKPAVKDLGFDMYGW